jgi:hypothetical protein
MTPKEKAKELVNKYLNASFNCKDCDILYCDIKCTMLSKRESKLCALIAVDEIINHHSQEQGLYRIDTYYWQEVKIEIEKL